ncbi:MAG: (2Fe-2S)-binding protein [Chloroflexota bacterium]
MNLETVVNGAPCCWEIEVSESLLDALRRHGYLGAKRVCESGECGACAVMVNGRAVDSCILLAAQVGGAQIVTVEGLARDGALHRVQKAFMANGAIQCGFCIPGMLVTAAAYLGENPHPTEEQVRHVLAGNLCRCTGYKKQIEAVLLAADGDC